MKIIKTRSGKRYYIFGALHDHAIGNYIEFHTPFQDHRLYKADIASEIRISVKRITVFAVAAVFVLVLLAAIN